jgi:flagellar motor switch protein FliN
MSDLSPQLIDDVVAACEAHREEAAAALSSALGRQISLGEIPERAIYSPAAPPEELKGSGLALQLRIGQGGMIALVPDSGGLVPAWAKEPSTKEVTKLNSLARELGRLLVPEGLVVDESSATWLPSLSDGLGRTGLEEGAAIVKLALASEGAYSPLYLIWPATSLDDVAAIDAKPAASASRGDSKEKGHERPHAGYASSGRRSQYGDLPPYARHLLKIEVPVMVNLVSKKQTIQEIMELGPGAIVNFEKSCDDPLELMVGNRRVALGSAVKVGDKFGIEITEVCLPDESFVPVAIPRARA